jgi:hypothetical protein
MDHHMLNDLLRFRKRTRPRQDHEYDDMQYSKMNAHVYASEGLSTAGGTLIHIFAQILNAHPCIFLQENGIDACNP